MGKFLITTMRGPFLFAICCSLPTDVTVCHAQLAPEIGYVHPAGVQAGTTREVTLGGYDWTEAVDKTGPDDQPAAICWTVGHEIWECLGDGNTTFQSAAPANKPQKLTITRIRLPA